MIEIIEMLTTLTTQGWLCDTAPTLPHCRAQNDRY